MTITTRDMEKIRTIVVDEVFEEKTDKDGQTFMIYSGSDTYRIDRPNIKKLVQML